MPDALIYKFNGGYGAVLCCGCRVIVDEGLTWRDAKAAYPLGYRCKECR